MISQGILTPQSVQWSWTKDPSAAHALITYFPVILFITKSVDVVAS